LKCPGFFRCRQGFCLEQEYLCDGIPQCPDGEDELLCQVGPCPDGCVCIAASVNCSSNSSPSATAKIHFVEVFIAFNSHFTVKRETFQLKDSLLVLDLRQNSLSDLPFGNSGAFTDLTFLHILDLRENNISSIGPNTFDGLQHLQHLLLSGNPVTTLYDYAFSGLAHLSHLNLSNLQLEMICRRAFAHLSNLGLLDLSHNCIVHINDVTFKDISNIKTLEMKSNHMHFEDYTFFPLLGDLSYMGTDDWRFCCLAASTLVCDVSSKAMSSCQYILDGVGLKISVWVIGMTSFFSNAFVVSYHSYLCKTEMTSHKVILVNLALSDLMMSFYLMGLGTADIWYSGRYRI